MINFQNALKVAGKFLSNDKINQALELSKSVDSPQSAINALSKLGDPNAIIDNGLNKLNSPTARKMASMFGANENDLEELRNQIMGMKNQAPNSPPITPQVQPKAAQNNSNSNTRSRLQNLLKGLK